MHFSLNVYKNQTVYWTDASPSLFVEVLDIDVIFFFFVEEVLDMGAFFT